MLDGYAVECPKHVAWRMDRIGRAKFENNGFQPKLYDYNPETDYVGTRSVNSVERLRKYIQNWPETSGCVLYFYGPYGTQKTTLANWVAARILRGPYFGSYVAMNDLVRKLNNQFDEKDQSDCQTYMGRDVLVIDEAFDKLKNQMWSSGKQLPALETFLKERIQTHGKGVIFISNQPPGAIASQGFQDSLSDFVNRELAKCDGELIFQDKVSTTQLRQLDLF
jgi:DNA replication protein DnaC